MTQANADPHAQHREPAAGALTQLSPHSGFTQRARVQLSESSLMTPPSVHLPTPALYPGQMEGVRKFLESKAIHKVARRLIFGWQTGVGKTAGALTTAALLEPAKMLIVCPALVRRHWHREMERWAPRLQGAARVIEWGRGASVGLGVGKSRREAYAARIQIVSYDLVGHITPGPWDLIILDEVHHIANPKSKQSKRIKALLARNPEADVLGLTATLIPSEAYQIWNPLYLLHPDGRWGAPARDGGVSWNFKTRYCHVERNDYGTSVWGVREEMRRELRNRLEPISHSLTREDISSSLPPLDLHTLSVEISRRQNESLVQQVARRAYEWAESAHDLDHLCILVHHRQVARLIFDSIRTESLTLRNHHLHYLDGSFDTARRDGILHNAAMAPQSILIGTHGALSEGIRLMWVDSAYIDEWSQSPGRMIQLLGRFQSVGSSRRPCVNLVTNEETYGPAQVLMYRLSVVQDLLSSGSTVAELHSKLQGTELSDSELKSGWLDLLDSANLNPETTNWSEECNAG